MLALSPDYYPKFQCIGSSCEDSCCIGWRVHLDKATYHLYKQNQHPNLRERFKNAVKRSDLKGDNQHFAVIEMAELGRCPFLDPDNLCAIHRNLGSKALSNVCATFPRRANLSGTQFEYSLSLACPEAARLALLQKEPMRFVEIPIDTTLACAAPPAKLSSHEEQSALLLNDLRALIIGILQLRELPIDHRLILLGLLLEDFEASSVANEALPPVLQRYVGLLGAPDLLRNELDKVESSLAVKIHLVAHLIGDIPTPTHNIRFRTLLDEAAQGLKFEDSQNDKLYEAYERDYRPYFEAQPHILENYLVHYVIHNLFPVVRTSVVVQYRELICDYLAITTLLFGQAVFHNGMTDALAIKTIQSYTRFAGHYTHFKETVARTLEQQQLSDLRRLFQLLAQPKPSNAPAGAA